MKLDAHTSLEPADSAKVPALSVILGFSPMLPFIAAAVLAWIIDRGDVPIVVHAAVIWAGAILCFLAGVRRGLSFRTPGGARLAEIASMFWLFIVAFAALASPSPMAALALLLLGYASVLAFDPAASRHHEAPPFFAHLRPLQTAIALGCLSLIALRLNLIS